MIGMPKSRLLVGVVMAGALTLASACSSSGSSAAGNASSSSGSSPAAGSAAPGALKVALVQINEQAAFFTQMNDGAKQEASKLGIDLTIYNSNNDASKQAQAIRTYVQQGYKAIIFDAIDVQGIKPAIQAAAKAGAKVIAVDAIVDDPAVDVQVGVDNGKAAEQGAQWLLDWGKSNGGDNLDIGVVGALNSFIQNIRKDKFDSAVKAGGAKIVQTVDGQNVQEKAASAAENLVTAQPNMDIMYTTGEPATIGAVAAIKSQGSRAAKMHIFGWDLSAQAIQGIDSGSVIGVIQQDPKTEGIKAVDAANTLFTGGTVEKTIDVPVTIVTKANVDPYRSIFGS